MHRDEIIRNARMKIHSMEDEHHEQSKDSTHTSIESSKQSRYQHLEPIAQGSMGEIFKAYDTILKGVVALKFVKASRSGMEERFVREARAQAAVQPTS